MIENQDNKFLSGIAENIKRCAKAKGMNITELATSIDMTSTGFYKMLEIGSYKVLTLKKIADTLRVSCSELLGELPDDSEKKVFSLMKEIIKEVNK